MDLIKALILGVVQGLTEFLPISSSGHLVIGAELLNFNEPGIAFDVFVHLGSLISVIIVFRRDILFLIKAPFLYLSGDRSDELLQALRWDIAIIVATIPAVVAGLFLKNSIDEIFANLTLVFAMLFLTGAMMVSSRYLRFRGVTIGSKNAFLIGCAQAMAIMPGLSRSGSTIFAGMALGIERQQVARFSFIMSIPVIIGAVVLQMNELISQPPSAGTLGNIGVGAIASAVSGYFAIILLLDIIRRNRLQWFGYYCLTLSVVGLLYLHIL